MCNLNAVAVRSLLGIIFFGCFAPSLPAQDSGLVGKQTALDRYVAQPDDSYGWKLAKTIDGDGFTGYVIDLTSQTWRTTDDVDRPVWKHWLTIIALSNPI